MMSSYLIKKVQKAHRRHRLPENQYQSKNTFAQIYDNITRLNKRKKTSSLVWELESPIPKDAFWQVCLN